MPGRTTSHDDKRASQQAGFILIPVLFVVALLALVTLTLTKTIAVDIRTSAQTQRQAEAEALADGLAQLLIRNLLVSKPDGNRRGRLRVDGLPVSCRIGTSAAAIAVQDAAGLVDLNAAPLEMLERLFAGIGASAEQAIRLAAAVVDFRDPDDVVTAGGAEAAEYQQAGVPHGPKNAPFATVGELDQVLGVTPEIMARVRHMVTVHSRARGVDPAVASADVRALDLPVSASAVAAQRSYHVGVGLRHVGDTRWTREFVIELSPRAPAGYLLKDWARGASKSNLEPPVGTGDLPLCLEMLVDVEP
jgi:type II secretory pathway component PulK